MTRTEKFEVSLFGAALIVGLPVAIFVSQAITG